MRVKIYNLISPKAKKNFFNSKVKRKPPPIPYNPPLPHYS